jgi:RHS repeat-associated protein
MRPSAVGNPLGYVAAWRSPTTGLLHMRMREYSPHLRRFVSPDPLGYVDSFNLWAYVDGDPVNGWDPWGLQDSSNESARVTIEMRAFAPYPRFGIHYEGDNRRFSDELGQSSRIGGTFEFEVSEDGTVAFLFADGWSSGSTNLLTGETLQPNVQLDANPAPAAPPALTPSGTVVTAFDLDLSGSNPHTSIAPDIDVHAHVVFEVDPDNPGDIRVTVELLAGYFPAHEIVVRLPDRAPQLIAGVAPSDGYNPNIRDWGPYVLLFGDQRHSFGKGRAELGQCMPPVPAAGPPGVQTAPPVDSPPSISHGRP